MVSLRNCLFHGSISQGECHEWQHCLSVPCSEPITKLYWRELVLGQLVCWVLEDGGPGADVELSSWELVLEHYQ